MRAVSTVQHMLTTKDGDVAGLILGNGTIVDMPPGHGETLKAMIKRGDEVRVEGEPRRSRKGRLHVHARRIAIPAHRNSHDEVNEANETPAAEEIQGKVRRLIYNGKGYVNGIRLANGMIVKTPPRNSEQILAHIHCGDEVRVEGHRRESSNGSQNLVADRIQVLRPDAALAADTEFFPETMPLLVNRAIALMRKEKAILAELQTIQQILEKNRQETGV